MGPNDAKTRLKHKFCFWRKPYRGLLEAVNFTHPVDATGIGVYAVWSSLLATVLFIVLAKNARDLSNSMDGDITARAMKVVLELTPLDACINGSRSFDGAQSLAAPILVCHGGNTTGTLKDPNRTVGRALCSTGACAPSMVQPPDLEFLAKTLHLLADCHTPMSYYRTDREFGSVSHWPTGSYLARYAPAIATADHNDGRGKDFVPGTSLGQELEKAVYELFHPSYKYASSYYVNTPLDKISNSISSLKNSSFVRELVLKGDPTVTGTTWRLSSEFGGVLWVSMYQTLESASCFAKNRKSLYFDPTDWQEYAHDCDGDEITHVFLIPSAMRNYRCIEGLDARQRLIFESNKKLIKEIYTNATFMGATNLRYDDVVAVYTGALAAVFGGAISTIAILTVIAVVAVCRAFGLDRWFAQQLSDQPSSETEAHAEVYVERCKVSAMPSSDIP